MPSRFALALPMLTLVAAATTIIGCSSDDATPPAFATGGAQRGDIDERTQLRSLAIGDDEPVVDESDADAAVDSDLEANPLSDDEEEAPELRPLSAPPLGQSTTSLAGRVYRCPGTYAGKCVCVGSPLNCQFANDVQPGRDRYLPPSFIAEFDKRGVKFDAVLEAGAWEATPGFELYDGQGNKRGVYKRPCSTFKNATGAELTKDTSKVCVRVNFGQMRDILLPGETVPKRFVYVLSGLAGNVPASGWVPYDSILQKTELAKMGAHSPRHVKSLASTSYLLKSATDWNQDPKTFVADNLPAWAQAGVGVSTAHVKPQAGDYLLRNGNVINLIYSTPGAGGASTDTFLVEHDKLAFHRATSTKARPTLVRIPVDSATKKSMVFAFGSIAGRFGWIALDAIKIGDVDPTPPSACAGKPDATYCDEVATIFGYACKGGVVVKSLQCPAPFTHCKGPSADGTALDCDNR